jgi:hypothetical protein
MFATTYISQKVPFAPAEAAAIADLWHARLGETRWSHYVRGADRLWLGAELSRVHADRSGIREAPGILWVRGLPVPISFELSVWSTGMTSMAIRPRGRVPIVSRPSYDDAAYDALQNIARCFADTKESVATTKASYRAITETVLDRTFAWPTVSGPTSSRRPKVTGARRPARVKVDVR